MEKVTVYMPTKNRLDYLQRSINSILNQTYKNIELIVVDDGSTDDTPNYMQSIIAEHPNVKYIRFEESHGANHARNVAIKEASGYFLTGLDDDDLMTEDCIESLYSAYSDEYAYVFGRGCMLPCDEKERLKPAEKTVITLNDMLDRNITRNQVFTTKKMFVDAGMFDETLFASQDYDMWIRMLKIKNKAKMVDKIVYKKSKDSPNKISSNPKRHKSYFMCYIKHKDLMTREQRVKRLLTLRKRKHNKDSLKLIMMCPWKNIPGRLFKYYRRRIKETIRESIKQKS